MKAKKKCGRDGGELLRVRLGCGAPVVVRAVTPSDGYWLARGLRELSTRSRFQRFLQARYSFTARELEYLTGADGVNHIALGALRTGRFGREIEPLGVARCIRDTSERDLAEVAVVVADAWQRKGLGRLLLQELSKRAWQVGIRRWRAIHLADNIAARKLLLKVATPLASRPAGYGVVDEIHNMLPPRELENPATDEGFNSPKARR